MGSPKALLPWPPGGPGVTLIEYQVAQIRAGRCSETVVVLGAGAERLAQQLGVRVGGQPAEEPAGGGLRLVLNPDYRSGKCSSIRAGVAALSAEATGALILAVDQPRPAWMLDRVVGAFEAGSAPVVVPTHDGRRGHPPLFAASLFPELQALSEERQGLREVLLRHSSEVKSVEVESPLIHVNLNRPEDYEAALRLFSSTC
jgi:molybdenum cofactor cytidylyltransferase